MSYSIPLFDLNFDEAEEKAVLETIKSKWISTGPKTITFENRFAELLDVKHAVALSNCTVALHLALMLAGVKQYDEVVCPSLTFVATVNAIKYVGATPVFADVIGTQDLTIDPIEIERKITSKTKAIIVMHYGGFACHMTEILEIAKHHKLIVIEDASHAPLSQYEGRKLGTIGDIGCFSFFSNKNISTGEGGMLVTNNDQIVSRARLLRSHGMTTMSFERSKGHATAYDVVDLGFNYRMDDIRASIGIVQLEKLEHDLIKRSEIRDLYIDALSTNEKIIIPFRDFPHFSSNYIFPIVLDTSVTISREEIRQLLANDGIQTSVHYPAVHEFALYSELESNLPYTSFIAKNEITLPLHSGLNEDQIDFISERVGKYVK